jgi:hypothetical protein
LGGPGGAGAGDKHRARAPEAVELFDRLTHDARVVTAVGEFDDDDDEPDEFEDELEAGELDATDPLAVVECVLVWCARAGSWPETSSIKIQPVLAMKIAVAPPTTRRRMRRTRRRRICRGVEDMASASAPYLGSV